jgi:hypothetical protein
MIDLDLLPSVKVAVSKRPYGRFSILHLGLDCYSKMTAPRARGFGMQFFDTASKGLFDTNVYTVRPVAGLKNPQIYEKIQKLPLHPGPTYPPETLLKDATVEQAMERVFEIHFERMAKHYAAPFVETTKGEP